MSHPKEFAQGLSIGIIMDGKAKAATKEGCRALEPAARLPFLR